MLDAEQGLESQDLNIHNLIVRNRKGCVIVVNKWDLIEKGEQHDEEEWREFPDEETGPVQRHSDHLHFGAEQTAYSGSVCRRPCASSSRASAASPPGVQRLHPARDRGDAAALDQRQIHPYQIRHAVPTPTPQFAFFVNLPQYIKEPYRRFLENKIREQWDFSGVPCSCISGRSNSRRILVSTFLRTSL